VKSTTRQVGREDCRWQSAEVRDAETLSDEPSQSVPLHASSGSGPELSYYYYYSRQYAEVSATLGHRVDELLVGVVKQIRLRAPHRSPSATAGHRPSITSGHHTLTWTSLTLPTTSTYDPGPRPHRNPGRSRAGCGHNSRTRNETLCCCRESAMHQHVRVRVGVRRRAPAVHQRGRDGRRAGSRALVVTLSLDPGRRTLQERHQVPRQGPARPTAILLLRPHETLNHVEAQSVGDSGPRTTNDAATDSFTDNDQLSQMDPRDAAQCDKLSDVGDRRMHCQSSPDDGCQFITLSVHICRVKLTTNILAKIRSEIF